MIRRHPNIYEINTRVWLKRFNPDEKNATLKDVPKNYWLKLKEKGIDAVWLMGVWETNTEIVEKYCFEEGLMNEYSKALKDWQKEDVIGSPYAISRYQVNPAIGTNDDLMSLKLSLNELGIKLILDFVPNHFSVGSELLKTNPEVFLQADKRFWEEDPYTFFKLESEEKYFAHGRDPFFPAWQDTAQVNYFNPEAREFMVKQLYKISRFCDGVRCDMAMLALNNVFGNTWGGILSEQQIATPELEFWKIATSFIRDYIPDFIFIAEAYWDLEFSLQQLGFDYTYDKKLTDRLRAGSVSDIRGHLNAEYDYQNHSLRFIENHDEERAVVSFGQSKSKAAAVITSTVMGMRFYHDGQWEGKRIKLPVQLGREPIEKENEQLIAFYNKLLSITNHSVFHEGEWLMYYPVPAGPVDETHHNMLAWCWKKDDEKRLVVVNYSSVTSRCRIRLPLHDYADEFVLIDLWNDNRYVRNKSEVVSKGLFVELGPYNSHIFKFAKLTENK